MGSVARVIMERVADVIADDHTSLPTPGSFDLSGVDQVRIGRYNPPPTDAIPFVWVAPSGIEAIAAGVSLGRYGRGYDLDIMGFVGGDGDDPGVRIGNALDLADDLIKAIENDVRTKGGALFDAADIIDVTVRLAAMDGDENDIAPGLGVCFLTVSVPYQTDRGI